MRTLSRPGQRLLLAAPSFGSSVWWSTGAHGVLATSDRRPPVSTLVEGHWLSSTARDPRAIALYFRHYSSAKGGRKASCYTAGFVGQGEKLVLLTEPCDGLFVWVHSTIARLDGQVGVNCAVFRNEGEELSSELIREADELAWTRWPDERRHFTYVDGSAVRSANPGCCFKKAGWRRCGESQRGLLILERTR